MTMKLLVISHVPLSTKSNMGRTLLSLLSGFDRQELCQLYLYPSLPDVDRCNAYYRVTDKDLLRSLRPGGEVDRARISACQGLYENPADQALYKDPKNKSALRRLLRDALWSLGTWDHSGLEAWLDREQPDCILTAPGAAMLTYTITLRIAQRRHIPVICYLCDEFYFVKQPKPLLDGLRLKLLRRKVEALMASSAHLVVISPELEKAYGETFGIRTTTLMTGANLPLAAGPRVSGSVEVLGYFGNLRCNRYVSLQEIGRELDRINLCRGRSLRLRIYSPERDPRILDAFSGIRSVELRGFVTGRALTDAMAEADLLLHVEAFDEDSIDRIRHSVSTKIPDSLASGIPLFAYGPEGIASMDHLLRNRCAIIATSKEALAGDLETALFDGNARRQAAENALAVAARFHDSQTNGRRLYAIARQAADTGRTD